MLRRGVTNEMRRILLSTGILKGCTFVAATADNECGMVRRSLSWEASFMGGETSEAREQTGRGLPRRTQHERPKLS